MVENEKGYRDEDFNEEFLIKVKRVTILNYLLLIISFVFTVTGLYSYILFRLQYGEMHQTVLGELVNDVLVYTNQIDYAYTRLIVCLLFSLFLYGIVESNEILNLVHATVKDVLEDNKE
jgi:hypothetical protein